MYHGVGPSVGTSVFAGSGVAGGTLASTGFDSLAWVGLGAALLVAGLVLVRLGSLARADRR